MFTRMSQIIVIISIIFSVKTRLEHQTYFPNCLFDVTIYLPPGGVIYLNKRVLLPLLPICFLSLTELPSPVEPLALRSAEVHSLEVCLVAYSPSMWIFVYCHTLYGGIPLEAKRTVGYEAHALIWEANPPELSSYPGEGIHQEEHTSVLRSCLCCSSW